MNMKNLLRRVGVLSIVGIYLSSQSAFASSDIGTLTIGHTVLGSCDSSFQVFAGFYTSKTGSYSPTGLTGGNAVYSVGDSVFGHGCSAFSALVVSGFSSNPGQSWLTSTACNGVTNSGSSVFLFQYDSTDHVATWYWIALFGLTGLSTGTNVSCTIEHS